MDVSLVVFRNASFLFRLAVTPYCYLLMLVAYILLLVATYCKPVAAIYCCLYLLLLLLLLLLHRCYQGLQTTATIDTEPILHSLMHFAGR